MKEIWHEVFCRPSSSRSLFTQVLSSLLLLYLSLKMDFGSKEFECPALLVFSVLYLLLRSIYLQSYSFLALILLRYYLFVSPQFFYIYLYFVSMLFLIYVYTYLLRKENNAILTITRKVSRTISRSFSTKIVTPLVSSKLSSPLFKDVSMVSFLTIFLT